MKKWFTLSLLWMGIALSAYGAGRQTVRKQLFDANWSFSQDSSQWRALDLPHDWSIEGTFSKDAPAGNDGGYLPTGKGWYRKTFTLDKDAQAKKLRLYFEGVYMNSLVYVNGQKAGGHPYGYSSISRHI